MKRENDVRENDLKCLSEPIRQYLLENYHLNCEAIITADSVKVVEIQESIPLSIN